MPSIVQKYLSVNPRRLNPFNAANHDFAPSGDTDADADYLASVADGSIERFYITLVELANRAGHYNVVAYDGYNNNVLFSAPVRVTGKPYPTADDPLLAAVELAIATAARHELPFLPELARVFSRRGQEHAELLQRYAAGADAEPVTSWVSWNEEAVQA